MEDVNIVVFGTQYYMIEGEDNYGYKFKLYFCLEPPEGYTPPSVKGDVIQLKELQYFDIGATYKLLEIQKESSSTQESTNLYITGEDTSPTSVGDVEMIELQGIKAWAFKYDYTDEESEHKYLSNKVSSSNSPDGYDLDNSDYTMSSSDREYLDLDELMLDNISVESVSFYDLNNSQKAICEIEPTSTNTLTSGEEGQTTSSTVYRLATARAGTEAFYNPQDFLRGGYSSPDVTSGEEETPEFEPFQVPRFENTDIFKGGNKASLSMAIRLKYVNSNNKEEYFDCTVKVEITREISIDSSYKVVKDDEGFNVSNLITVSVNGIEKTEDVTYLSDTLEMKIPANSSTSFEMILKRGDEEIARTSFSQGNTGVSYNKTYFISLSEKFGVNVKEGDKVEIIKTNSSDSTEFIYNGSSGVQEFTIDKTMSDTLEMRIPANTSTSFEMILSPTNGEIVRTSFSLENTDESDKIYEISLSEKFGVNVQEGDKVEIIKTNKFIYNGSSGAEFTISVITQDKVCIDDASQLDPNMYYPVTKYYIVNVKIGLITYSYQADGNMYVTGKFFKLVKDYSTEIAYVLQKTENSTSTENSISNWFSKSSSYPIYLVGAEIDTDGNIVANNDKMSPDPDTNQYLKYLKFSIDTSDGGSGKATIDEEGTITIQNDFSSDEYIKVLVQMKVSGGSYINIGYIRLGLTKTSGTT